MKAEMHGGRLGAEELAANFADLHPPFTTLEAQQESARCLFCFDAPCTEACPTGIDIPGFIRGIASGNLRGAAMTILGANILGGSCARVCPVEELCEQVCVKQAVEQRPVPIGRLQRHATDHLLASGEQPFTRAPDTGRRVAVVGAGPAGLACAHRLACHGHEVVLFDARDKPGGLNEYGIAAYKLVDEAAAREVAFILGVGGITVHTGRALGAGLTLDALRQGHDAVFLALGHNAVNALGLPNEDASGVHNAVDFIARIRQQPLQDLPVAAEVVVVGGGNTAIDIAVQAKLLGAESVTLVYRRGREQMGATAHEQALAQTRGVLIRTWAKPVAIETVAGAVCAVVFERTDPAQAGQRFRLPAGQLFKAIGQGFEPAPFAGGEAPEMAKGRIAVDAEGRTSLPGVWAGGDCVPGRDLTVTAVADGRRAAESIHAQLSAA